MAKVLDIPVNTIKADVSARVKKRAKEAKRTEANELYRNSSGIGDKVNPQSATYLKASKIEEAILGLMQLYPSHLKICVERLKPDDFVTEFCKKVFLKITECYIQIGRFDIAFIEEHFSVDEISRITKMMAQRQQLTENGIDVLNNLIDSLLEQKAEEKDEDDIDSILGAINKKKK